jgi:hypothetical protein
VRRGGQVVGVAVETDEEARRFSTGPAQDPRSVAGTDVDDDLSERADPLEQSSTVDRALRFSLHDDHCAPKARRRPFVKPAECDNRSAIGS